MKKQILLRIGVLLIIVVGVIMWGVSTWRQRTFNGKPESYWLKSLTIQVNPLARDEWQERDREWRTLGAQGAPILFRALEMQPGPGARNYARLWPKLPAPVQNCLPTPFDYRRFHGAAWYQLSFLTMQHTNIVIPEALIARALKDQEWPVRMSVLNCLTRSVLPNSAPAKDNLLPLILRTAQDQQQEVKMIAVLCLAYYKDQSDLVIPALTNALHDPYPDVRIRAAMALHRLDPMAADTARVKDVAYDCLKSSGPHGSAPLAAKFLKELQTPTHVGDSAPSP